MWYPHRESCRQNIRWWAMGAAGAGSWCFEFPKVTLWLTQRRKDVWSKKCTNTLVSLWKKKKKHVVGLILLSAISEVIWVHNVWSILTQVYGWSPSRTFLGFQRTVASYLSSFFFFSKRISNKFYLSSGCLNLLQLHFNSSKTWFFKIYIIAY